MLPALRTRIYTEKLAPDVQADYHLDAAAILAQHSKYTDAAYHLAQRGTQAQAIQLCFSFMETKIQWGQAGTTHDIFANRVQRNQSTKH